MSKEKKRKSIVDSLTYAYIRKIKKWMFCPDCQQGKMIINKESTFWTCEECGYKLSADEFEDDYVFWFCDECNAYLNNQEGFDRGSARHISKNCGYENDTTINNEKRICSDCGKVIPDPEATLCSDCELNRKQREKEWLSTAKKVIGVAAAVAGVVCLTSQTESEEGINDDTDSLDLKKDRLRSASEGELRAKKERIKANTDWRSGSILNGDFDCEIEALDAIDEEINRRSWERYNSEDHSKESYGVRREHGWYLQNDD